jgi:hypothetical protein
MNLPAPKIDYFSGLDRGQSHEYSALVVFEKSTQSFPNQPDRKEITFGVRHIERFPLRTSYPEIASRLRTIYSTPPLTHTPILVDLTMVGNAVMKLLRNEKIQASLTKITIRNGLNAVLSGSAGRIVPKKDLVRVVQILLQTKQLKIAQELDHAKTLIDELQNFKMNPPTLDPNDPNQWREGIYDDLVFALAMVVWKGEKEWELKLW